MLWRLVGSHEGPCDASSPTFWLDMCSNIATNVSEYVNLQLNPERWTGYNGSHVWDAIYQENCFVQTATDVEQVIQPEETAVARSLVSVRGSESTLSEYPSEWGLCRTASRGSGVSTYGLCGVCSWNNTHGVFSHTAIIAESFKHFPRRRANQSGWTSVEACDTLNGGATGQCRCATRSGCCTAC